MGRVELRIILTGLVVVLVILSISIPFSLGIVSTMERLAPKEIDQTSYGISNEWQLNNANGADPGSWNGSSGQGMCYDHTGAMNASEMVLQVRDMMNESRDSGLLA